MASSPAPTSSSSSTSSHQPASPMVLPESCIWKRSNSPLHRPSHHHHHHCRLPPPSVIMASWFNSDYPISSQNRSLASKPQGSVGVGHDCRPLPLSSFSLVPSPSSSSTSSSPAAPFGSPSAAGAQCPLRPAIPSCPYMALSRHCLIASVSPSSASSKMTPSTNTTSMSRSPHRPPLLLRPAPSSTPLTISRSPSPIPSDSSLSAPLGSLSLPHQLLLPLHRRSRQVFLQQLRLLLHHRCPRLRRSGRPLPLHASPAITSVSSTCVSHHHLYHA